MVALLDRADKVNGLIGLDVCFPDRPCDQYNLVCDADCRSRSWTLSCQIARRLLDWRKTGVIGLIQQNRGSNYAFCQTCMVLKNLSFSSVCRRLQCSRTAVDCSSMAPKHIREPLVVSPRWKCLCYRLSAFLRAVCVYLLKRLSFILLTKECDGQCVLMWVHKAMNNEWF